MVSFEIRCFINKARASGVRVSSFERPEGKEKKTGLRREGLEAAYSKFILS